jgi:site-specific DNA-methyltransferase (adenine-specific)
MGFDFYGTEIDKEYFDAQEKRFKRECLGMIETSGRVIVQQSLF